MSGVHAVGAIRALRDRGLSVPKDVSIVCVNDTELTRYFIPPITAVDLHEKWLGYWAIKSLIQFMQGDELAHQILIPGKLVIRKTSGRCPDQRAQVSGGGDI